MNKEFSFAAGTVRHRGGFTLHARQVRLAWLMLVPALAVLIFVALYPLVRTVYSSFTDEQFLGGTTHWVGFANYYNIFTNNTNTAASYPDFYSATIVTLKFAVISVVLEFLIGLGVALVLSSQFKGRGAMRAAMLVPWAIPTVVSAEMWKWMFNDISGVINDFLLRIHVISSPESWLADPSTWLGSVIAVDVWKTTPFVALLLLAGLQVIPSDIYEAAAVDGATGFGKLWRITLPLLRPAIAVTLIFRTLDAIRVFDIFNVFFGNTLGKLTMATAIQTTIVANNEVGYGAALSVVMFVLIAIFVVAYTTIFRVEQQ
jgi:trehalose/maltose transport system permease protein